jgi:hypothetical protein
MYWHHREPTLEDMLSDPIIRAVMDADRVDPHELKAMLTDVGRALRAARGVRSWGQWPAGSQHLAM